MKRAAVVLLASGIAGSAWSQRPRPFAVFLVGGVGVLALTVYDLIEEIRHEDASL